MAAAGSEAIDDRVDDDAIARCPVCRAPIAPGRRHCSRRCATISAKRAMRLRARAAGRVGAAIVIRACESCGGILAFVSRGGPARRYHPRGECERMERRLKRKT